MDPKIEKKLEEKLTTWQNTPQRDSVKVYTINDSKTLSSTERIKELKKCAQIRTINGRKIWTYWLTEEEYNTFKESRCLEKDDTTPGAEPVPSSDAKTPMPEKSRKKTRLSLTYKSEISQEVVKCLANFPTDLCGNVKLPKRLLTTNSVLAFNYYSNKKSFNNETVNPKTVTAILELYGEFGIEAMTVSGIKYKI